MNYQAVYAVQTIHMKYQAEYAMQTIHIEYQIKPIKVALGKNKHIKDRKSEYRFNWNSSNAVV